MGNYISSFFHSVPLWGRGEGDEIFYLYVSSKCKYLFIKYLQDRDFKILATSYHTPPKTQAHNNRHTRSINIISDLGRRGVDDGYESDSSLLLRGVLRRERMWFTTTQKSKGQEDNLPFQIYGTKQIAKYSKKTNDVLNIQDEITFLKNNGSNIVAISINKDVIWYE